MRIKWPIGRRIIKTGVAVFITAILCHTMNLPASFAIITAIVTIEPTVHASIKKGLIRLPAAAIGACFAVLCDIAFGETALTYALIAIFTITTCAALKLDPSTLVATLTATAMVPGIVDVSILDVLWRITGSFIGITVSTFVNFLILPAKFGPLLVQRIDEVSHHIGTSLQSMITNLLDSDHDRRERIYTYKKISEKIQGGYELSSFQNDEWRYRSSSEYERRSFDYLQKKLDHLNHLAIHLGKMAHLRLSHPISELQKTCIMEIIQAFVNILKDPFHQIDTSIIVKINQLSPSPESKQKWSPKTIQTLHYELQSIYVLLEELAQITKDERQYYYEEEQYPAYIFQKKWQYD
ncbi:FUSC family protein [Alkalihalobacillus sp. 1P02AB]|uniref:FUSC family protein n=1 Tax=Alkalihalobacillus sp. 1P02AB TaxID=3132260 RepID=UPI0039A55425